MDPRSKFRRLYDRAPIAAQNAMVWAYGRKVLAERVDRGHEQRLADLLRNERVAAGEQRVRQGEQLQRLLQRAATQSRFYRERFAAAGLRPEEIRDPSDLQRLPLLTRDEIQQQGRELLCEPQDTGALTRGHTSGTTGSPLSFWWDANVCHWNQTVSLRYRRWAGLEPGDPIATLLGNEIVPLAQQRPPFWRACSPLDRVFFSSFHLAARNLEHYVAELRRMRGPWLEAYPSTALALARYLETTGQTLPLRGVFVSSEPLLPAHRTLFEERFETAVWDAYSMAERVLFAGECEQHDGQHLSPEYGIVEILDADGHSLPPGRPGRVVATGLQNWAMPLIRYDTGDVSAIDLKPCPCGRTLPRLAPITTKSEDIIVTPEGRWISPSTLTHPFKPLSSIAMSQLVQETPELLRVRVVPAAGYREIDSEVLRQGLRSRLGDAMRIEIELVDSIPRSANGKLRWVISQVPLRFEEPGAA